MFVNRVLLQVIPVSFYLLSATSSRAGVLFTYNDFTNTNGLTLVGNTAPTTTSDGQVLRLTPANTFASGAAYSTTPVALGSNATFSTQFQFRLTGQGGIDPADGFTFLLATSTSGLGVAGGGLGYQGVPTSLAIEFDTYFNGGVDTSSNHVAIDTGGVLTNTALTNVYGIATCDFSGTPPSYLKPGCMSNGDLWTVNIGYDGALLNVTLFDPAKGVQFAALTNYAINIASQLGQSSAFVGFTSATGSGVENHDILNWTFANTSTIQSQTPEPATMALCFIALASGLFLCLRRNPNNDKRWSSITSDAS